MMRFNHSRHVLRFIVVTSLASGVAVSPAFASHMSTSSANLGAGSVAVPRCATPFAPTYTYSVNSVGNVTAVGVGNIPSTCANGSLKIELAGSGGALPLSLGPVTITTTNTVCSVSNSIYTCPFTISGTVVAANVANNYASVTGP